MNKQLDIPTCIKDYEGGIIDEKEFMEKLPTVAELAVGDACTGSNPRSINPEQMAKLLKCCYYDEEVEEATKELLNLMEPAIIIFMAVFVVIIVLAIYLPMINMTKAFDKYL